MKRLFIFLTLLFLLVSCNEVEPDVKVNPDRTLSLTTKQIEFVNEGHGFDFSLIHKVSEKEKADWVMSPFGVQVLLGMILNGAQGETAEQIYNVLGFENKDIDEVNDYFRSMLQQLPELDYKTEVMLANGVFVNKKYKIKPTFSRYVRNYYSAYVENLDFSKTSSLKRINDWCNEQTEGLVPKMLDEKTMSGMSDDIALLLNALYFKGEWTDKFDVKDTSNEPFHLESGVVKEVPMMKKTLLLAAGSFTEDGSMIQVPFGKKSFALTIILPGDDSSLNELINKLDDGTQECCNRFIEKSGDYIFDLWMPRIEAASSIDYRDILSDMGMSKAFSPGVAELRAMCDNDPYIKTISQNAVLSLDEEGVRAAAASFVRVGAGAAPKPATFHADRPFLYLISELTSGIILFAGAYTGI